MKKIRISEAAESKIIEDSREDEREHFKKSELKETKADKDDADHVAHEEVYNKNMVFPSRYYYLLFCILLGNSNESLPIAVRYCITLSCGKYKHILTTQYRKHMTNRL